MPVCATVPVFTISIVYTTLVPATSRLVVSEVFWMYTPSVALMAFVTGLESSHDESWSARVRAVLTTCVATGGRSTVTSHVAVIVPPGGRVRFCPISGGDSPANTALLPTSVNVTLSNHTKSSAPIVPELRNRIPVLVEIHALTLTFVGVRLVSSAAPASCTSWLEVAQLLLEIQTST